MEDLKRYLRITYGNSFVFVQFENIEDLNTRLGVRLHDLLKSWGCRNGVITLKDKQSLYRIIPDNDVKETVLEEFKYSEEVELFLFGHAFVPAPEGKLIQPNEQSSIDIELAEKLNTMKIKPDSVGTESSTAMVKSAGNHDTITISKKYLESILQQVNCLEDTIKNEQMRKKREKHRRKTKKEKAQKKADSKVAKLTKKIRKLKKERKDFDKDAIETTAEDGSPVSDVAANEKLCKTKVLLAEASKLLDSFETILKTNPSLLPKSEVFIDIDPKNRRLFEYFSKIASEADLEKLLSNSQKYEGLLQRFDNDETLLLSELSHLSLNNSDTSSIKHEEPTEMGIPFELKVYEKDLNVCFELSNGTDTYFSENLYLLIHYISSENEIWKTKIDICHGIGPKSKRIFTKFKSFFEKKGGDFSIEDFGFFEIKDGADRLLFSTQGSKLVPCNNGTDLMFHLVAKYNNLTEINLRKLENFKSEETIKLKEAFTYDNENVESDDVISTTITNDVGFENNDSDNEFEEYDFLSESDV
ncbi:hypothetical protein KAFR_0C01270 [Kazachstania africana CBS 2517]|uniref:Autophagy protein Atg19/Atg34 C-terminal domain-containing protein n=1 Tax=Kazachstania africana (strain ATCC 22294 / BCRC 22015 / CBS 2517 / CECT 1963 / NBRC 1671 / NRRL Y-8276) TaxID=1071382 RepID=H2ARX1_KAZAF|nr:hypothetical protein KAFR_0C01270 [Kazachstania africana CBS 2517]CCF57121.1 hypothetical protein KAFR_0C01270 [Kazachstania africana CBS 2517]